MPILVHRCGSFFGSFGLVLPWCWTVLHCPAPPAPLRTTHSSLLTSTATDKLACHCPCETRELSYVKAICAHIRSMSNHSCQHCRDCWCDHLWDTQELKSRSVKDRNISLLTFTNRILTDPKALLNRYEPILPTNLAWGIWRMSCDDTCESHQLVPERLEVGLLIEKAAKSQTANREAQHIYICVCVYIHVQFSFRALRCIPALPPSFCGSIISLDAPVIPGERMARGFAWLSTSLMSRHESFFSSFTSSFSSFSSGASASPSEITHAQSGHVAARASSGAAPCALGKLFNGCGEGFIASCITLRK